LEYFDIICNSPSQLYHSALPLSPSSSWLRKCYSTEFSHEVKVVKGARVGWGTCFRTVSLGTNAMALSYWNNSIAVGSRDMDIIILDAVSGSQMTVLSGHTKGVNHLTFSSDGRSLVSGSDDDTVKLWDIQTGGAVKTFYGHTGSVWAVSISVDCTRIASGSEDQTICLWDIQTGVCYCIIEQEDVVDYVSFSPMNPQHIISISSDQVWEWDANGYQIPPTVDGTHFSFSQEHAQFALCYGNGVTVQKSDSRAILAEMEVPDNNASCCCFSPDGRFIAVAAEDTVYVWDITSPDPPLVETFAEHGDGITSLVFSSPSSLVSASQDKSVKFWKIGTLSTDLVTTDLGATPLTPPSIQSVGLQARAGIATSSDADNVIKAWDISTGICNGTFQMPTTEDMGYGEGDAKIINGRLIFVWCGRGGIHIWDVGKGEHLQSLDRSGLSSYKGIRISGDGSKVFCLFDGRIQAWSMWSWEPVGWATFELGQEPYLDSLCMDGSRVQIRYKNSSAQEGWDFGNLGSSPVPFDPSMERPRLDFISGNSWQGTGISWIRDTVTGREVFRLSGEYANPLDVQWDGQYLVAGYGSGKVFILDFCHVLSRDL
jgi:WD40 repeat protein